MPNYRIQVNGKVATADTPADIVVNVLWYAAPTTTPSAIGDAIKSAFTNSSFGPMYNWSNVVVKVYDHANPPHSPPVYQTTAYVGAGTPTLGPRQVAVCVSFYSGLNIKGQRGRIYVGPWPLSQIAEMVPSAQLTQLTSLIGALQHPGGGDVVHMIHHVKTDSFSNVSNYFVNNRWDTMRSRLAKETSRVHVP